MANYFATSDPKNPQTGSTLTSLARVMAAHNGGMPLQGRPGTPVFLYAERRLFIYLFIYSSPRGTSTTSKLPPCQGTVLSPKPRPAKHAYDQKMDCGCQMHMYNPCSTEHKRQLSKLKQVQ